jgi:hypothetical protein
MQRKFGLQLAVSNVTFEHTPSAALSASPHWSTCIPGSLQHLTSLILTPLALHKRKSPAGVMLNSIR